jgi:hypothetical protein
MPQPIPEKSLIHEEDLDVDAKVARNQFKDWAGDHAVFAPAGAGEFDICNSKALGLALQPFLKTLKHPWKVESSL